MSSALCVIISPYGPEQARLIRDNYTTEESLKFFRKCGNAQEEKGPILTKDLSCVHVMVLLNFAR